MKCSIASRLSATAANQMVRTDLVELEALEPLVTGWRRGLDSTSGARHYSVERRPLLSRCNLICTLLSF